MPELKLVERDTVGTQSKEENACFLSLILKPPLDPLVKTSCLFVHLKNPFSRLTLCWALVQMLGIQPQLRLSSHGGQGSRWLFKAKR